jgi:hypothetical protein
VTILLCVLALVGSVVLLILGVDPVPTWFYVFAWYPTLVLLDVVAHRLDGRARVLRDLRRVLSLFGWSAVIWLVFEAANFRLDNWYYVFLPRNGIERWAGILLSFATVVPAILLAERTLEAAGVMRGWHTKPVVVRNQDLIGSVLLGFLQLALAFIWPNTFFPQIWGATFLLAEPLVYRRRPDLSLFADLSRGEWGRTGRLLLGGLGIGLLWESYNYWARGKWVYTVPWLEGTKWFEMPPFGFVGFAFFALEAWAMYHALCAAGIALPLTFSLTPNPSPLRSAQGRLSGRGGRSELLPRRAAFAAIMSAVFVVATLLGMERWTISSVVPRLADLPGLAGARAAALTGHGIQTPFALARSDAGTLGKILPSAEADTLAATARLSVLRGIGARHVTQLRDIGVDNTCALSRKDPGTLWVALHKAGDLGKRPTRAEVRVWVNGAAQECAE